jgi:hypothetical protein
LATFARSLPRTILPLMRAKLIAVTGLDTSAVFISCLPRDKIPHLLAAQDVVVVVGGESPHEDAIDGAGVFDNRRTRDLEIVCRTRVLLDVPGQDTVALTDASLGHLALEDACIDALELFMSGDDDTGDVFNVPARVGRISRPERTVDDRQWCQSEIAVRFEYERALTIITDITDEDFR